MAKYRAVLMVPSIIEFESEGSEKHVTEQAHRVMRGMGKCESLCTDDHTYEPTLMEIKRVEGDAAPPNVNVVFHPALA